MTTEVIRSVASATAPVGCSSPSGDHESSAHFPVNARHRQERKCVALRTRRSRNRRVSEDWRAMLFRWRLVQCKRTSDSTRRIYATTLMVKQMSRSVRAATSAPPTRVRASSPKKFMFPLALKLTLPFSHPP